MGVNENPQGHGKPLRLDDITQMVDKYADEAFEAGWAGGLDRALEAVEVHGIDGAEAVKAELRRLRGTTRNTYEGPCLSCDHDDAHTALDGAGCTRPGCTCFGRETRNKYTRVVR